MSRSSGESTLRFVEHFFRAYPGRTALMVGLLIGSGIAEGVGLVTLLPLLEFATGQEGGASSDLTRYVVEAFEYLGLPSGLGPFLILIVVAMTLKAAFLWLAMKQVGYTVSQVATDLRLRLIRALLKARWSFFARKPTGYFANAISTEAQRASGGYQMACEAFAGLVQILIYLGVVFVMSWQVAAMTLVLAPVLLYALRRFIRMSREAGGQQTRVMKQLVSRVTEVLPGLKAIKAMGRERTLLPFLEEETKGFNEARQRTILARESLKAFQEPLIILVLAGGLYGAVALGGASPTAVLVGAVLFYRIMKTTGNLQTQYQGVTANESAFWSLMETLGEAEGAAETVVGPRAAAPPLAERIRFRGVSFAYDDQPVLRSVDLEIPAGRLTAVVGASGAGKTTLVDLLAGLLSPDSGEILVDGTSLAEIDRVSWRRGLGYVPQDTLLFHDTIFQNVTLGEDAFDEEDVRRALRAAGAREFVVDHPDGIHRVVGERGSQLSGGQRQRISIARALVSRPRLLILDEATTSLDPETEAEICRTLAGLRGETTIVAISHQAAIREVADVVYSVAGGRVRRSPDATEAVERTAVRVSGGPAGEGP